MNRLAHRSGKKTQEHVTIRRIYFLVKPVSYRYAPLRTCRTSLHQRTHTHSWKTFTQVHNYTYTQFYSGLTLPHTLAPSLSSSHARNYQIQVPVCKISYRDRVVVTISGSCFQQYNAHPFVAFNFDIKFYAMIVRIAPSAENFASWKKNAPSETSSATMTIT